MFTTFKVAQSFIEYCLAIQMLKHHLGVAKKSSFVIGVSSLSIIATALLRCSDLSIATQGYMFLIICSLVSVLLTSASLAKTLFWGSISGLFSSVADAFVLMIWNLITDLPNSLLLANTSGSYIMAVIHTTLCLLFTLAVCSQEKHPDLYPGYFYGVFWFFIFCGAISIEMLLDVAFIMQSHSQSVRIKIYLCLFLLFAVCFLFIGLIDYIGKMYIEKVMIQYDLAEQNTIKQQYKLILSANNTLRDWKHDLINHIQTMKILLQEQHFKDLDDYLCKLALELPNTAWTSYSGNTIIDSVLTTKAVQIHSLPSDFQCTVFLPDSIPLTELQWTSLLGNLLDNAIESCRNVHDEKKYVCLNIRPYKHNLCISIENSSDGQYLFDDSRQLRSKKAGEDHGLGLFRIKKIVSDLDGFIEIIPESNVFKVNIVLPLIKKGD